MNDYQKLDSFKTDIQKYLMRDTDYKSFRQMLSVTLRKYFGYNYVLIGNLPSTKNRELSLNVVTQNLESVFVQKFFSSSFITNGSTFDKDIITLSQKPNYKKLLIYKELLAENHFADFMIIFLSVNGLYNGFIIVFSDNQYGEFKKDDILIADNIREYLGYAYQNYEEFLALKITNDSLITQANYYPIGLVFIKNYSVFMYANSIAQQYMSDMGISNSKFFPMFFSNYILPEIKYQMASHEKQTIVRYQNYIFSIVTMRQVAVDVSQKHKIPSTDYKNINFFPDSNSDITTYIYIMRDDLTAYENAKYAIDELGLSKKEKVIIEHIGQGKSNKQIADDLGISVNTVRVHVQNIYKKAHVTNRSELLYKINSSSSSKDMHPTE